MTRACSARMSTTVDGGCCAFSEEYSRAVGNSDFFILRSRCIESCDAGSAPQNDVGRLRQMHGPTATSYPRSEGMRDTFTPSHPPSGDRCLIHHGTRIPSLKAPPLGPSS